MKILACCLCLLVKDIVRVSVKSLLNEYIYSLQNLIFKQNFFVIRILTVMSFQIFLTLISLDTVKQTVIQLHFFERYTYWRKRWQPLAEPGSMTKTYLYNFDPIKHHLYIVKLEFTGVCIIFHMSAQKYRLWILVRSPQRGGSKEYPQCFFGKNMKNMLFFVVFFFLKIFSFWRWNVLYIWIGVFSLCWRKQYNTAEDNHLLNQEKLNKDIPLGIYPLRKELDRHRQRVRDFHIW